MLPEHNKSVFDYEDVRCFPIENENLPFDVEMCGVSHCDGKYYIRRDNSDVMVCEYIICGSGTVKVNGQCFHPQSGDVFILPIGSIHEYYSDREDPWVKIWINLRGKALNGLLDAFNLKNQFHFTDCRELVRFFDEFFCITREDVQKEKMIEQCYLQFMKLLVELWNKRNETVDVPVPEEARKMRDFIDRNVNKELSIKDISGSVFRSADYANRLFKRCFGTTPYAYYLEQRMSNAKALLGHTSLSIMEISARLGYKNYKYFSKQFTKNVGMTASQYRKHQRQETLSEDQKEFEKEY